LIVEDHQATREGLAASLSRESDMQVIGTAGTSDEGLSLAKELQPDVILLDLHLPGAAAGPKTMVKQFCDLIHSRIVVFSVENRQAFVKVVMSMGVAAYLLKSESLQKVADTIRQVVAGKKNVLSDELSSDNARITKSEEEVLRLIGKGLKYQDIADQRDTSPNTVRKQCETLLLKLNLTTREELIAWAVNNGYASIED
jgi:two-component system, NarL family, nitrate/nitrite response regulator NarL